MFILSRISVGVLFIMWQNIGKGQDIMRKRTRFRDSNQGPSHPSPVTSFTNHLIIHADCHAANKGKNIVRMVSLLYKYLVSSLCASKYINSPKIYYP